MILSDVRPVFACCLAKAFKRVEESRTCNEVFKLKLNSDMLEKCDTQVIELHFEIVHPFLDGLGFEVPTVLMLQKLFRESDDCRNQKLSKYTKADSRNSWSLYEANKFHIVLSLSNRYPWDFLYIINIY